MDCNFSDMNADKLFLAFYFHAMDRIVGKLLFIRLPVDNFIYLYPDSSSFCCRQYLILE